MAMLFFSIMVFILIATVSILQYIGFKLDLNKSLNFFGFGLSDSDPEPLNPDVKLKYKEVK